MKFTYEKCTGPYCKSAFLLNRILSHPSETYIPVTRPPLQTYASVLLNLKHLKPIHSNSLDKVWLG